METPVTDEASADLAFDQDVIDQMRMQARDIRDKFQARRDSPMVLDQPRAEVVSRGYLHVVYGWTHELVTDRGTVPLAACVGVYRFAWSARRAMRRWLREHK